jgi:hypothetical protein
VNLQPRIPVRIGGFLFPAVRVSPDGLSVTGHRSPGATRLIMMDAPSRFHHDKRWVWMVSWLTRTGFEPKRSQRGMPRRILNWSTRALPAQSAEPTEVAIESQQPDR